MEPSPAQGKCVNTACGPSGVVLQFLQLPCMSAVFQHAVAMHRPTCLIKAHSHRGILNIHLECTCGQQLGSSTLRILRVGVLMSAWG